MHIDLRFSVLSFFLVWAALLLTVCTSVLFIRDRPRRHTIVLGVVALLLWTAGTLVPILT
jgi:hypothetical protein